MNDYIELHEIDDAYVRMRIFSQRLAREVRAWFRNLATGSIADMANFHMIFIERWERKKNPLQMLYEYENIRRGPKE